jgi:7-cyano-7-deazaguanine synthase
MTFQAGLVDRTCIVAFSGGQDSATVLTWALSCFSHVETFAISYGQSHAVELTVRKKFLSNYRLGKFTNWERLGEDHVIELPLIRELSGPRYWDLNLDFSHRHNKLVPGRNMMILSFAAAIGSHRDISDIACGVSETEYSGYFDCRNNAITSTAIALEKNIGKSVSIHTPLMYLNKAGVWKLGYDIGGSEFVQLVVNSTHTCYKGNRDIFHDWGFGCGECDACKLRKKGWLEFQGVDT